MIGVVYVSGVHKVHIIEVSCEFKSLTKRLLKVGWLPLHIFHSHFKGTKSREKV